MKFIIFTYFFEGLPLALKMMDEGSDVRFAVMDYETAYGEKKEFADIEEEEKFVKDEEIRQSIGDGMIKKYPADEIFKNRQNLKSYYFIFDMNFGGKLADILRKEGFKVFGSGSLGWKIEHDRKYGMDFMKKIYGIDSPPELEYGENSADKAINDVQMSDKAFVLKPDDLLETFLPRQTNIEWAKSELLSFMESNRDALNRTPFILQEKIFGYEVAVECMYSQGKPIFAHIDLETKRKYGGELGKLTGCTGELDLRIDLDAPIVKIACEPFYKIAEEMKYTGPMDLNVIFKDKKRYYGLEFCGLRPGYSNIYNWLNMVKMPVSEYFSKLMDGNLEDFETDNFGASVTIFNDNETKENVGFEINEEGVWPMFVKSGEGKLKTAGYDEVAYFTKSAATPEEAFKNIYEEIDEAVTMPNLYWRRDLGDVVYPNPIYRYYRLREMNLL